ncbi:MAG: hypothetical protein PHV68_05335 [Candidatus Gastranaerophilales bacterium]|nr:hypothetical protein [Candidatus Gastranaerophilales bacterium]
MSKTGKKAYNKFSQIANVAGFSKADLFSIDEILKRCQYGKNALLKNYKQCIVKEFDDYFELVNFNTFNQGKYITGVCSELSSKIGLLLNSKFKEKYIFILAGGSCKNYNAYHIFILAIKNTKANKLKVLKLLDNDKKFYKKYLPKLLEYKKYPLLAENDTNFLNFKDETLNVMFSQSDFENFLIIDPSYNVLKLFSPDSPEETYKISAIFDIKAADLIFSNTEKLYLNTNTQESGSIILGYVKKLAPEIALSLTETAIFTLKFIKKTIESPAKVVSGICTIDGTILDCSLEELNKHLSPKNSFLRFLNHLQNTLNKEFASKITSDREADIPRIVQI